MDKKPITPKSWDEFRDSGLAWFINQTLHVFGWTICFVTDDAGKAISCHPARTMYRGFTDADQEEGYVKVTHYLKENIQELDEEVNL